VGYHRRVLSPRPFPTRPALALLVLASLSACAPPPTPFVALDGGLDPLRTAFNADAGQTRVVMLVSPTCDVCLRGASAVYATLLAREPDPRLRPFIVWVPKLRGKSTDIAGAATIVPDARLQHFWDGGSVLMNAYQQVLGLSEDAWDVYLVYGPETRWEGDVPPTPRFWMHQLGTKARPRVRGVYLEPAVFARDTLAILKAGPAARQPVSPPVVH
jgi:hypothetical protein